MTGRSIWPVVVVMCLVVVVAGAGWHDSTAANGIFVYALDDAYIHLTIGRTLAEHGVWGVSPREFSSASSSPLWTIILALWCRLFGVSDLAPLALNVLFGCLLIAVSDSLLCRSWAGYAGRSWHRFAFLCALMFAIPMPALILSGMEHLLHTLLAVLFALKAAEYLWPSPDTAKPPMGFFTLAGIAALTVAARYESMALVAPVFLVLAWRRRWSEAVPLVLASLLPVILFGIYSISNNMPFVPASILVKTIGLAQGIPAWFLYTPLVKAVMRILICPSLLVMMTLGTYSLFRAWREPSAALFRNAGAAGLFVLASLIHADFVGVGWFYRYEAYLIAVGMTTALPAFVNVLCAFMTPRDDRQTFHTFIFVAIVIILFWPFITRSVSSLVDTPLAYRNIGDQQMQLARFLAAKGTGKVVALNDIGAVGYYSDTPILDLFGLASPEVYRVRIRHEYSTETIDRLARQAGAETAILTPDWYRMFGGIPASWTQVATWKIENNIICASDAVSFYAIEPDAREDLERRLKEFEPSLPFDVKATFTGSSGR